MDGLRKIEGMIDMDERGRSLFKSLQVLHEKRHFILSLIPSPQMFIVGGTPKKAGASVFDEVAISVQVKPWT